MKFPKSYSLKEIAEIINARFVGEPDFPVQGMNEIHVVTAGDIVFVDHPKYYEKALQSKATVVLINTEILCPPGKALLVSEDPFRDFNKLTTYFRPFEYLGRNISETALIGENTTLQPNVSIGNHVVIGKNCIIQSNVTIYDHCIIGNNVIIHAGSVLGADAFYYQKRKTGYNKLLSGGRVILEDDVEIGALCTIDKGVTGDTLIKKGTKLDNQVQIGHDTVIGEKCLIAAQTGIAGCVTLEDEVTLWGQVGVISAITIGKGAIVLAQSGVARSLPGGKTYMGSPAVEARAHMKVLASARQLGRYDRKLKEQ